MLIGKMLLTILYRIFCINSAVTICSILEKFIQQVLCWTKREHERKLVDSSTGMEACYRKYRNFLVV